MGLCLLSVMGQLFSGTSKSEALCSSFTEYFQKFKVENKIISQEISTLIELYLTLGDVQQANNAITYALR